MAAVTRAQVMRQVLPLVALLAVGSIAQAFPKLPAPEDAGKQVQAAIRGLNSDNAEEQLRAATDIRKLAPFGDRAIPTLIDKLRDAPPNLTSAIADALAAYGHAAKDALPLLTEIIRQPRAGTWVSISCSHAIAALGDPGNRDMLRIVLASDYNGGRRAAPDASPIVTYYPTEVLPVVADLLADPHRRVRARAAYHLFMFPRALAGKSSPVDSLPSTVRSTVVASLRSVLDSPEPQVRVHAVAALLYYDPAAIRDVAPRFLTILRRKESYGPALESLSRRGADAARVLMEYLDEPDAEVRREISRTIANCPGAAPVLSAGLRDPNPMIRTGSLDAIAMNPANSGTLRAGVLGRLKDENAQVRLTAATTLVALGAARADAAVPALSEAALSRTPADRHRALVALQSMGAHARPAVPTLFRCTQSGDMATRFAAARTLSLVDRTTWQTYVRVYVDVLENDAAQRQVAIRFLTETGPDAKSALPALRMILKNDVPNTRIQAAEAVARISPNDCDDAIGQLAGIVSGDQSGTIRDFRIAIRALQRIGAPARSVVPILLERMRSDPDTDISVPAATAAILIDPDNAKEAYHAFRAQLQPGLAEPDAEWLDGIANLGKAAKPLIPDLIAAAKGKRGVQRTSALETLAVLGPEANDALPALKELEKSGKSPELTEAIRAIEAKKK